MPADRPTPARRTPAPRRRVARAALVLAIAAPLAAGAVAPLAAATDGPYTVDAAPLTVAAGGQGTLQVTITMAKGYTLMAPPAPNKYATPTTLILVASEGLAPLAPVYPDGKKITEEDAFEYHAYEEKVVIKVPVQASADAKPGPHVVKGTLRHQPIHFGQFGKTKILSLEFTVEVTAAKSAAKPAAKTATRR
jgi:hypothetical protein